MVWFLLCAVLYVSHPVPSHPSFTPSRPIPSHSTPLYLQSLWDVLYYPITSHHPIIFTATMRCGILLAEHVFAMLIFKCDHFIAILCMWHVDMVAGHVFVVTILDVVILWAGFYRHAAVILSLSQKHFFCFSTVVVSCLGVGISSLVRYGIQPEFFRSSPSRTKAFSVVTSIFLNLVILSCDFIVWFYRGILSWDSIVGFYHVILSRSYISRSQRRFFCFNTGRVLVSVSRHSSGLGYGWKISAQVHHGAFFCGSRRGDAGVWHLSTKHVRWYRPMARPHTTKLPPEYMWVAQS